MDGVSRPTNKRHVCYKELLHFWYDVKYARHSNTVLECNLFRDFKLLAHNICRTMGLRSPYMQLVA